MALDLARSKGFFSKIWTVLKWVLLALVLVGIGSFSFGVIWMKLHPAEAHKAKIETFLKESLHNDSLKIGSIHWSFNVLSVGLKAVARDVEIDNFQKFKKITIEEIAAELPLWKLYTLSAPLSVKIRKPQLLAASFEEVELQKNAEKSSSDEKAPYPLLPSWARRVHLSLKVSEGVYSQVKKIDEVVEYKDFEIFSKFNGLPGSFAIQGAFEPKISVADENTYMAGKLKFKIKGHSLSQEGRLVGLNAPELELDLADNLIITGGIIEKTPGYALGLRGSLNLIFSGEGNYLRSELNDGDVWFSSLHSKFDIQHAAHEGLSGHWSLPRTRVENFYLPLKFLRLLPFKGIVESKFQFKTEEEKYPTINWQMALNNLEADVSKVEGLYDNTSFGKIILSLATQGDYANGIMTSPRLEVVFNATDAHINFNKGQVTKKLNDKFEFLLKAYVRNNKLSLQDLGGEIHTMKIKGKGEIDHFSEYIKGGEGQLDFGIMTNRVHLRDWSSSLNFLVQSPPLEGFMEMSSNIEGPIKLGQDWSTLKWRVSKLTLANVTGAFDPKELLKTGLVTKDTALEGRFHVNLLASARGVASEIQRAQLNGEIDLTDLGFIHKSFKKELGIPFVLNAKASIVPNELQFERGRFRFHTADLKFSGRLRQGAQKSQIDLVMDRPIELSHYREFFPRTQDPLKGKISWTGSVTIPGNDNFAQGIDWKKIGLMGKLKLEDISGRWPGSEKSIKKLSSSVAFGKGEVLLYPSIFQGDNTRIEFRGSLKPKGVNGYFLPISDLLSSKRWSAKLDVKLDSFSTGDSSDALASRSSTEARGSQDFIEFLRNPYVEGSDLDLKFQIGNGKTQSFSFSNLSGHLNWAEKQLRLSSLALTTLGGDVKGDASIDARSFYLRNEDPVMASSLQMERVNLTQLLDAVKPELKKVLQGNLSGKVELSSRGILVDDLIKKSSGRIQGQLSEGQFESFLILKGQVDEKISQSSLRKLLVKEVKRESCIKKSFQADLDAFIRGGDVDIASSRVNFTDTDSHMMMKGKISRELTADLRGDFFAGPRCIGGDIQKCLGEEGGKAKIPFTLRGPAGTATAELDLAALSHRVQSCVSTMAKNELKKRAQNELENNKAVQAVESKAKQEVQKIESKAKEALNKIFQGP